jgi:uncharacterized protein YdhG (YjbR/CyaY superfamily)
MTATTIDEYIADAAPAVCERLTRLRATIASVAPDAAEKIRYGMPALELPGGWLHFAAWKRHIGLYPVHQLRPDLEARVAPYRSGADTVKFPLSEPTPFDLVREIVEAQTEGTT